MNFIKKYGPKNLSDICGQEKAILKLVKNVRDKKASLLYGTTGVGKTSSIYALANELGYEVLELNAGDFRGKEEIEKLVGGACKQKSLFLKDRIILIDDVDAITGKEDRGCIQALVKILKENEVVILLTCEDPYDKKLKSLRKVVDLIEFKKLNYLDILKVLKKICKEEKIRVNKKDLMEIVERCGGDLRAAINDLECFCISGSLVLEEREKKKGVDEVLNVVFKSRDVNEIVRAFNRLDINLDEFFLWLDENLPREYFDKDLANAYEMLSKADVFRGRIIREQYYRLLSYVNCLLTIGVGLSKENKRSKTISYKRSGRILKIWIMNRVHSKRNSIVEKIAEKTHCSWKKALEEFAYLKVALRNDKELCGVFELCEDEVGWLDTH